MRRVAVVISVLLFFGVQVGFAQATQPGADYVEVDPDRPVSSLMPAQDTFGTYGYTFGDIVIFSFEDDNLCKVVNPAGDVIWSDTLMMDGYALVSDLAPEVYEIQGSEEFSVLTGDPFNLGVCCWFAVDQNSRPLSTKLLSVGPKNFMSSQNVITVFSYHDGTHVLLREIDTGDTIWEGDLDSAEYYFQDRQYSPPIVFSVEANKPVSAGTFSGVVANYAPAFNGTFTGRDFMTYYHGLTLDNQDMNIIPWEDETNVVVTDLDNPADTIWEVFCEKRGETKGRAMPTEIFVHVHADKDISVCQNPWASYTYTGVDSVIPAHLVRGIDRDGLGLGAEFFMPLIQSDLVGTEPYPSRLHIIAYEDNTQVTLGRIPSTGGNETTIWQGTLNRGEFFVYENLSNSQGHATYHVTATEPVSVIGSHSGLQGADFLPLWFAIHPDVAATPDQFQETECKVPVSQTTQGYYEVDVENNGNIWDVVNIFTTNSGAPDFSTELFDELGGVLPDVDGDGNPDSDTLAKGASVLVLADVTPVNNVPFGTTDTCFFEIISVRDAEKTDTALLVTRIRPVAIGLPDTVRTTGYPGEFCDPLDVYATNTSDYRADTVNLSWTATKPEATWEVRVFDAVSGFELTDTDGDGSPDVPDVPVNEEQEPFRVQVFIPDTAIAGDEDTIFLVGHSANYPFADYPTVIDTSVLIVTVEPAPAIMIRPDTTDSVPSGHAIYYPLEVLNYGNGPDVPEIISTSTQTWNQRLLDKDLNDLPDTDTDGTPDAGSIPGLIAGQPGLDTIYLEVRPPYSALSGVMDSTVVRATSSVEDTVWDIATVRTITRAIVSLDIDPDTTMTIGVGDTAVYELRVTNNGGAVDTVAVGSYALPALGWSYEFTFADSSGLTDSNGDGDLDMGAVDSATTEILRLLVIPHEDLGKIKGEFDTTVTEIRYVWIRTVFTDDMELVNDSVQIVTIFAPELDIHNYPNPFSAQEGTTFAFTIPRAGIVTLRVYNRAGEHIVSLLEDEHYALGGVFRLYWNGLTTSGNRPAPGVYLYTLEWKADEASGLIKTKRITKKALLQP